MKVGVSMVLSFMVVWDLPRIAGGVTSLETSRLSAVYAEVAPSVSIFGELFGRALQAQVLHSSFDTTESSIVQFVVVQSCRPPVDCARPTTSNLMLILNHL